MIQRIPKISTPGSGCTYAVVGNRYRFLATGDDTDGRYASFEALVYPGGGPPPHVHSREDEGFFILEGEVAFYIDGARRTAGPGTMLNVPIDLVHSFKNETERPAKMLVWAVPAGLDKMFQEAGTRVTDPSIVPSPPTPAEIERIMAVAPRYGIEIKVPYAR